MAESSTRTNEEFSDLELPFEKLNVSSEIVENDSNKSKEGKKLTTTDDNGRWNNNLTSQNRLLEKPFSETYSHKNIQDDLARVYCTKKKRRHKSKSKSVIRKARLILPIELQTHKLLRTQKGDSSLQESEEVNNCTENENKELSSCVKSNISTCGSQYMNSCNLTNFDVSSPEQESQFNANELASYFEQILYIPKPMSLMAEMMYA